ncbi:MAG: phosphatase PAP2 family protein [Saprospiraceae bacterium]
MFKFFLSLRFALLLLLIQFSFTISAQENQPYELSWKMDVPLLAVGLGGQLTSTFIIPDAEQLTDEEIVELDKNDIWPSFDSRAVGFNSKRARVASDYLLIGSQTAPFLLLLDERTRKGWLTLSVMAAEVVLLNGATTSLTKQFSERIRPYAYDPDVSVSLKKRVKTKYSFYSGHTSAVSSITFFGAKVFSDYFPDSKVKPVVWTTAAVLPALTGYFRVRGGRHFPTDVTVGYLAGGLIGYLVPVLHKKRKKKKDGIGFQLYPGFNSVGLTMTW